ncbi:MAG: arylsulfatase [Phycisphaerae bacterium]|nr:arylsulfatase [Phycisphaerae bacterium]
MNRRAFLKSCGVVAGGLAFCGCQKSDGGVMLTSNTGKTQISGKRPNLLLIMTDQHRFDCLGCMGNDKIQTPNLDAIAADGVIFNYAYSQSPSCTPARAGLLTGLSPWHHGMLGYSRVAEHYKYEKPRMLREAGYYTFSVGKQHWYPQKTLHGYHGTLVDESGRVESPGFISDYRRWFKEVAPDKNPDETGIGWNEYVSGVYKLPEELHPTVWTGKTACDFIKNYDKQQPWMMKVSFARPHSPYDPPQRFWDMYNTEDMPSPWVGDWTDRFKTKAGGANAWYGDLGVAQAKESRHGYYGSITFIDEQVGKVIQSLKDRGVYDETLIVFTADHGDMLGDHHHWRKTYAYEGSARIPMLLRWPENMKTKVVRGATLDLTVDLRDVLPTFLDAAGAKIPDDMDGMSMLRPVRAKNPNWREYIDFEHATCYDSLNNWCALTDGKIKYIYCYTDGSEQLFNLENDPHELTQLSGKSEYQGTLALWRGRMVEHFAERGDRYVKNGVLQKHGTILKSPNFPS